MTHAGSKEELQAALEQTPFDLILSDFALSACSGMAAFNTSRKLHPDTPFIFVAEPGDGEKVGETLKSGATDFVLKNNLSRLGPVVRRALREACERKERQRAEEQVRVQSGVLESVAQGVMLTDKAGTVLFANRAFSAMTGYGLEEVLGQITSFVEPCQHEADFSRELWKIILAGRVWHGELISRRKDGTFYNEEMTITPLRGNNGKISHFVAVKQDITRLKQLEEQAHHITKRKRFEEQAHQAQKIEAMSQLAGDIAHDFNNFLAVIQDNTKLALSNESQPPEQNRQRLRQAVAAADSAANLIRPLLAFGRKQAAQFQPCDLNLVIRNFTQRPDFPNDAHLVLQCHHAKELPPINADIGLIEQMLASLIANARDAMPQGGQIFITTETILIEAEYVETHPEARTGAFVCLTVSDTGVGIYPEYLPRIFEPFFTTKEAGTAPVLVWPRSMASSNNIRAGSRPPASWGRERFSKFSCRPALQPRQKY